MVKKITLRREGNTILLDNNTFDYDSLYKLSLVVIDDEKNIEVEFENFDEVPDIKLYYQEIFDSINKLSQDPELVDLKQKIHDLDD